MREGIKVGGRQEVCPATDEAHSQPAHWHVAQFLGYVSGSIQRDAKLSMYCEVGGDLERDGWSARVSGGGSGSELHVGSRLSAEKRLDRQCFMICSLTWAYVRSKLGHPSAVQFGLRSTPGAASGLGRAVRRLAEVCST